MHSTALEKHSMKVEGFLRTESSQTKTISLPVQGLCLNTTGVLDNNPAENKRTFAARAQARAQRVVGEVKRQFRLGKGVISLAEAAKMGSPLSTPRVCTGRESVPAPGPVCAMSVWLSKRLCAKEIGNHHEGYKVINPVLECGTAREEKSAKKRREGSGWKRSASRAETPPS